MLNFSTRQLENDVTILTLDGELDPYTSPDLLNCLTHEIEKGRRKIVVDCARLKYISSCGLGALVRVHARMKKLGGDVKVAALRGPVADVFRITMLNKVFGMYDSVEAAAESF